MKSNTFGLDLGTTSIKAMWLVKQGNEIQLKSVASVPSMIKSLLSESIYDRQTMSSSIRSLLKSAGITINNANICLPESQVYLKVLEMPELSEKELQSSLTWEMEQYIPISLDQVKTTWQILDHTNKDNRRTMHVLLVAAPIGILEKYDKIMQDAGIVSRAIETEAISVHRALLPTLNPKGADVIVHLGASTTDVLVTRNKIINIAFSIPFGGIAVTRAISMDLGVEITQAENLKRAYGLSKEMLEGKVGRSLAPILESIAGDIKKSILLYKEKNNNENITQIILSGGNALLPGIDVFFTNILDTQVVIANAWELNNIINTPQELIDDSPSYNVVLGLALRDMV